MIGKIIQAQDAAYARLMARGQSLAPPDEKTKKGGNVWQNIGGASHAIKQEKKKMGIRDKKKREHGSVRMDPVSEVSREQVAKEAEEILASTSD